jgi:hypothetical protein
MGANRDGDISLNFQGGGFNIPIHDYLVCEYTGANLTKVTYKLGGASGDVVAVVDMTYDGNNNLLTSTLTVS